MSDLRTRVPGHSLIDELLRQWDLGTIRVDENSNRVVIDEEAEGWYRGVIGERRVAALLAQLGGDWTVLHSVPVGSGTSDIDHVVIGPGGVYTINTKYSPSKEVWVAGRGMYVGGANQHYVTNMLHEARRASILLSRATGLTVPVTGLIVFVDPAKITRKAAAGGGEYDAPIEVLRDSELLNVFRRRPEFSVEQTQKIAAAAVLPRTWSSRADWQSSRGDHISKEFAALEDAVGQRLSLPHGAAPRTRADAPHSFTRRPAAAPRPSGVRRRKSRNERLISELVFPVAALIGLWIWLQSR